MNKILGLIGLILTIFIGFSAVFAGEGGSADGGGTFKFYRDRVAPIFKSAESELYYELDITPDEFFKEAFAPYQVDREEMLDIVRSRIVPNIEAPPRFRKTPAGIVDLLMLDFSLNPKGEKQVEVLLPWFDEAKAFLLREQGREDQIRGLYLRKEHKRAVLHETLHHFGIINDDLAFSYSLNSAYLGSFAKGQVLACGHAIDRFPTQPCLKVWNKEYKVAMAELRRWFAGFTGTGVYHLYQRDGTNIRIDTSVKRYLTLQRAGSEIGALSKCTREKSVLQWCEPKSGVVDGKKAHLSRLNKRVFAIGFSDDVEMESIKIKDKFLTEWPELMWLDVTVNSENSENQPLAIVKEK